MRAANFLPNFLPDGCMRAAAAAATMALVLVAAGAGAQTNQERKYAECMAEAADDPAAAEKLAQAWYEAGGGFPARHCAAAALEGRERFAEAASLLAALAGELKKAESGAGARGPAGLRYQILAQAGAAWLSAGDAARARDAFAAALDGRPDDAGLRLRRGLADALLGRHVDAVGDFNAVIDADPRNVDALVLRATAYKHLGSLDLALADLGRALGLDRDHPDALLERGIVRHMRHDDAGARDDWRRLVRAAPASAAAQVARENLEKLNNTMD